LGVTDGVCAREHFFSVNCRVSVRAFQRHVTGRIAPQMSLVPWPKITVTLGNILFQIGRVGAGIFAMLAVLAFLGATKNARIISAFFILLAVGSCVSGCLLRYIFAGTPNNEAT
jgi:hypothetical protein